MTEKLKKKKKYGGFCSFKKISFLLILFLEKQRGQL